jgi:hypothetical protein
MSYLFSTKSVVETTDAKNKVTVYSKDEKNKEATADVKSFSLTGRAKSHLSRMSKGSVKVTLAAGYSIAGTSGGATYQSQALSPIGVQDWSSYASLYDMCRTIRVRMRMWPIVSATPTVTGSALSFWAAAWDPSNLSAYSSTADMLTAQHFVGPVLYDGTTGNNLSVAFTHDGTYHLNVRLPAPKEQIANNNTAAPVCGGGWIATSDTNYICGWLKTFQGQLGSGITPSLVLYVWYDVEFKSRT